MAREVQIPIPENAIPVEVPGQIGVYYVDPNDPNKFTWVANALGTDGASYEVGADGVKITSYSTHDEYHNGQDLSMKSSETGFQQWQEMAQRIQNAKNA